MSSTFNKNEISEKMNKTIMSFKKYLWSSRTDRANTSMFDLIRVEVYGQKMPLNQLATITIPEPRTISIQVWDKPNVNLINSEIEKSNLGVNPQIDGQILRVRIPELTEERRVELTKVLKNLGEKSKVSIRNIRREANDTVKKLLKEKKISEDESKNYEKEIQENTDENINKIEKILTEKEKEILKLWTKLTMSPLLWMAMVDGVKKKGSQGILAI